MLPFRKGIINDGTLKPTPYQIKWYKIELGYRPKILFIEAFYNNGSTTIYGFTNFIAPSRSKVDAKYIRITDTGFEYNPAQNSFSMGYIYYAACGID